MVPKFLVDLGKIVVNFVVLSPLFAGYGIYVIGRGILVLGRGVRRTRLALRNELRCPNRHPNAVTGRWRCASCGSTYHGWVGRCGTCGAGAAWFPCATC